MSLLARAGGPGGALRRLYRQPRQTLTAIFRLVSSRLSDDNVSGLESPYRGEFLAAAVPKQTELANAFMALHGAQVRGRNVTSGEMVTRQALHIWSLIRQHNLSTVVETGVCNGLSSHLILSALSTIEDGHLLSIDLPEYSDETGSGDVWEGKGGAVVPAGKSVGWLVDENLKTKWDLRLGASRDLLPGCLESVGPIDLFVHDSEHSFDNQLFEFKEAFGALKIGGFLVLSDIQWSSAYSEFWQGIRRNATSYFLDHSCAVVRKTG